jgi:Fe-Mn family superoxide dismutase
MAFTLPDLPYPKNALAPHISAETLDLHHGKHHAKYVEVLNGLVEQNPSLAGKSLEDLVRTTEGKTFNQAAQVWNHTFYWHSMSPNGGGEPQGDVRAAIEKSFGSFADFKEKFSAIAAGHFASGWAWLVVDGGKLAVIDTHDADSPTRTGKKPLLTCDVWEHAYYIDYRNARPKYIEAFWNVVNWDHVAAQLR